MLSLLLTACSVFLGQDVPTLLQHATTLESRLDASSEVSSEVGPHRTFRYELEHEDSTLFLYALSEEADLSIEVRYRDPAAAEDDGPKSAASLLAGKKPKTLVYRIEDGGGGTTPFQGIPCHGGELMFRVFAKNPKQDVSFRLHGFEAPESDASRKAKQAGDEAIEMAQRLWQEQRFEEARATLSKAIDELGRVDFEKSFLVHQELHSLGLQARRYGALGAARTALEAKLRFGRQIFPPDHVDTSNVRVMLSSVMQSLGDPQRAFELSSEARSHFRKTMPIEDPHCQAAQRMMAISLKDLGRLDEAQTQFESLLELSIATLPEGHRSIQLARLNLAAVLDAQGDPRGASRLQEEALRWLPEEDPSWPGLRLNYADSLLGLGENELARQILQEVLERLLRTRPEDDLEVLNAKGTLALSLSRLGRISEARSLEESVILELSKHLGPDHPDVLEVEANLAVTLLDLGDLQAARDLQEKVLRVQSRLLPEDDLRLQRSRANLAATLLSLGKLEEALELFEMVTRVHDERLPDDHPQRVNAELTRANTLSKLRRDAEAEEILRGLLERVSAKCPPDHIDLLPIRGSLAYVLRGLGKLELAADLDAENLEASERALPPGHPYTRISRLNYLWTSCRLGERDRARSLALRLAEEATAELEAFHRYSSRELEAELVEALLSASALISIAEGAGVFESDSRTDRAAFELIELIRATPLLARRTLRRAGADEQRTEIARAHREVVRLSREPDREAFSAAVRERDRLERQLQAQPSGSDLMPLESSEIAERLRPGQAAVRYWRYERTRFAPDSRRNVSLGPSYVAWVCRPGEPPFRVALGSAESIEGAVRNWRRSAALPIGDDPANDRRGVVGRRPRTGGRQSSDELRRLLIDPVLPLLKEATSLILLPAGELHLVPFEAIGLGGDLLGDRFRVSYRIALSELGWRAAEGPENPPSLLVLGDPAYDAEPAASSDTSPSRGPSVLTLRSGIGSSPSFSWSFPRLEGTLQEATAIAGMFEQAHPDSDDAVRLLLGEQATRDAFESEAGRCRYVHLATHGWFAAESVPVIADAAPLDAALQLGASDTLRDRVRGLAPSLLCGVVFAGANGEPDMYGRVRGVMTAEEIGAMRLEGVVLCVLSACETNVGVRAGEGIASLQTALHTAGVRSAITSLWQVPDEATRILMTELYRRIWELGESKAEALWNAKKLLREKRDADGNPVYSLRDWAGWVLSGDPD